MAGISDKALKGNYAENRYKYNGKELQNKEFSDGSGLEEYDFGARMYDQQLVVWHNIDPLSEKMRRFSSYNFVYDNPERFVDPDGMEGEETNKVRIEYNQKTKQTTEVYISEDEYNTNTDGGTKNVVDIQNDGKGGDAIGTISDQYGKVLHTDNNPNVYMNNGKNTTAIGKLGGTIDASSIIPNLFFCTTKI
jgi:RHS repeat-associated protein